MNFGPPWKPNHEILKILSFRRVARTIRPGLINVNPRLAALLEYNWSFWDWWTSHKTKINCREHFSQTGLVMELDKCRLEPSANFVLPPPPPSCPSKYYFVFRKKQTSIPPPDSLYLNWMDIRFWNNIAIFLAHSQCNGIKFRITH